MSSAARVKQGKNPRPSQFSTVFCGSKDAFWRREDSGSRAQVRRGGDTRGKRPQASHKPKPATGSHTVPRFPNPWAWAQGAAPSEASHTGSAYGSRAPGGTRKAVPLSMRPAFQVPNEVEGHAHAPSSGRELRPSRGRAKCGRDGRVGPAREGALD